MTGILPAAPVINEIHYNNDVNYIANEFVEIYNPGPDLVNLSGWQITGGVEFLFPENTLLDVDSYLVVAENPNSLRAEFQTNPNGPPIDLRVAGPYAGGLSGEVLVDQSQWVTEQLHQALGGKLPIIGVGGIHDVASGKARMDAGASLIQVYSSFIYQGPKLVKQLVQGL